MKFVKLDYLFFLLILIISLFFVLELFIIPGRPANFDSNFHITNIAQFSGIIRHGELPVVWMNSFANYGLPMGIFAHQITSYLGGVINLLVNDPTTSYNVLVFIAILLSNLFLYLFLRFYFSAWASFLGTFMFNFTPYRIFNIYVRGAMPEVFSAIFLPLILISLYILIVKRKSYAIFLLSLFVVGLALCHPMMLVVYSLLFIPYLIYLLITTNLAKNIKIKLFFISFFAMLLGVLICGYYILPLNFEIKYVYYGFIKNHIDTNTYLKLSNFIDPRWYYFTNAEVFPRGHVVLFGLLESLIFGLGLVVILYKKIIKKSKENVNILFFALVVSILLIFFTTRYSNIFFQNIFFLNNIQFPWRFLSGLIFLPAIIIAYVYDQYPRKLIIVVLVIFVAILSFPQLYGKNFNIYPKSSYYFSKENAHSILMNTIWSGKSEDYPNKKSQGEIIEGNGKILSKNIKNSQRDYLIDAKTPLRIVDNTFYFPGWNAYIDGIKETIEFQNPDHRGVITFQVPAGKHDVKLRFEDTKIRLAGKMLTFFSLFLFIFSIILRKHIYKRLD